MKLFKNPLVVLSLIFLLSFLMHFRVFNLDLIGYHSWRQTQTQINIEGFYKEDFNILNPRTYDKQYESEIKRLEFPIMQWLFALFYKIFGQHLIITRILSFSVGIFSVAGIFFLLKNIFQNEIIGIIGAWSFNFSPVFYYYTMNPLPDNFALCCSIWGLAYFFIWTKKQTNIYFLLSNIFLSIGALAKLPYILNFTLVLIYLLFIERQIQKKIYLLIFTSFAIIPVLLWYILVIQNFFSNPVLLGIFSNDNIPFETTLNNLRYIVISTLPELLINYGSLFFFIAAFFFISINKIYLNKRFIVFFSWGVFLIIYYLYEVNAIGRVHDYYLLPFLPPIFILVSYGCYQLLNLKILFIKKGTLFLLFILPLTAYLRANSRWNTEKPGFNSDLLKHKKELKNSVPHESFCIVGNDESHNIWFYYLEKKGWAFEKDNLTSENVKSMIDKGAKYLFSDSRIVEENGEIKIFLDSLIIQRESIKVFVLKNISK